MTRLLNVRICQSKKRGNQESNQECTYLNGKNMLLFLLLVGGITRLFYPENFRSYCAMPAQQRIELQETEELQFMGHLPYLTLSFLFLFISGELNAPAEILEGTKLCFFLNSWVSMNFSGMCKRMADATLIPLSATFFTNS